MQVLTTSSVKKFKQDTWLERDGVETGVISARPGRESSSKVRTSEQRPR